MKVKNMTAGTLVRTVMLAVALLNLVLTSFGKNPLPFSDEQIYTGLSALVTVAAALAAWWKNNSFTCCARQADEVLRVLQQEGATEDESVAETLEQRVTDVCTLLLPADNHCLQGHTVPQQDPSLSVRHLRLRLYQRLWGVCFLNGAAQFHHSSVQYPPVDPSLPGYGRPGGGRHGYGRGGPVYERKIRHGLRNYH